MCRVFGVIDVFLCVLVFACFLEVRRCFCFLFVVGLCVLCFFGSQGVCMCVCFFQVSSFNWKGRDSLFHSLFRWQERQERRQRPNAESESQSTQGSCLFGTVGRMAT